MKDQAEEAEEAEGVVMPGKFQELVAKAVLSYPHKSEEGCEPKSGWLPGNKSFEEEICYYMRDHLGKRWIGSNWKGR